jgi:hypothetical protein
MDNDSASFQRKFLPNTARLEFLRLVESQHIESNDDMTEVNLDIVELNCDNATEVQSDLIIGLKVIRTDILKVGYDLVQMQHNLAQMKHNLAELQHNLARMRVFIHLSEIQEFLRNGICQWQSFTQGCLLLLFVA